MTFLNCFCSSRGKKKDWGETSSFTLIDNGKDVNTLHVKLEHLQKSSETAELRTSSFGFPIPFPVPGSSRCKVKVINHDSPLEGDSGPVHYDGGDEHEETLSMKRDYSDFDLQAHVGNSIDGMNFYRSLDMNLDDTHDKKQNSDVEVVLYTKDGHLSDPDTGRAEFCSSPKLKRSCSDLVIRTGSQELVEQLHLAKSKSDKDMQRLAERYGEGAFEADAISTVTVMTHGSADKVILKKHSSSQILPSRSRRLWWKLFLWSHRNLHRAGSPKPQPVAIKSALNLQGGYSSDTVEPRQATDSIMFGSPVSLSGELTNEGDYKVNNKRWDGFYGVSGMWPQNQWVAFPTESSSPLERVNQWVKEISVQPLFQIENDDCYKDDIDFPPSPDNITSLASDLTRQADLSRPEEISHANSVIQSLNASSTVAHIAGIGLKVIPSISHFSSLRSLNLSGNCIAHITPGSVPKGLHILNLSRNKITTIEGLRESSRLRVIDLSYNRISRIGQGLSKCTLVKELYLVGNNISHVEGLHRLLKLTVLDLSFNKITTTKALGQLVANYNSLIALNLLGNPVQSNIGDDQLRKTICSLLPKLAFLNKQPINSQKAREIGPDAISKAALGNSNHNTRRKAVKRVSQRNSPSSSFRRSSGSAAQTSRQRPKSRYALKDKA